jgi:26S proteasome regulatory subunit N13
LTDILSPSNISQLLHTTPSIIQNIRSLLPEELNLSESPTAEELTPILTAPQFTDAIASLDRALRTAGLPASMMREMGLPPTAGNGVKEFLDALKGLASQGEQAGQGGTTEGDRMDTD